MCETIAQAHNARNSAGTYVGPAAAYTGFFCLRYVSQIAIRMPTTSIASTIDSQMLMSNTQRKIANGMIPPSSCRMMAPIELLMGGTLPITVPRH